MKTTSNNDQDDFDDQIVFSDSIMQIVTTFTFAFTLFPLIIFIAVLFFAIAREKYGHFIMAVYGLF